MNSASLSYYPYLQVSLTIEGVAGYATLNFEHTCAFDSMMLSNRIHVYLLDPKKGSMTFYLEHDTDDHYYYPEQNACEIDSLIIYALNEAIRNHLNNIETKAGDNM
ncbi:MAG: hypothetical protein QM768_20275 [Agriterribacter sp.]